MPRAETSQSQKDPADGATDIGDETVLEIYQPRRIVQTAQELHQRRLPGTIGPDECDMFAESDRKGEVPDRHTFVIRVLD